MPKYTKETAYEKDHCINSKKHPLDIIFEGVPLCDNCWDKVLEKRFGGS